MLVAIMVALAPLGVSRGDFTNCNVALVTAQVARSPTQIVLQIVPVRPVTKEILQTMVEQAAAIWARYNIILSPVWTAPRPDRREGLWLTVIVRNQPANRIDGKAPQGRHALASLTFSGETPGNVIYASFEMALRNIRTAGIGKGAPPVAERFASRLLGRAVAHELGHFLLGSKNHSKKGLMRASFSAPESMADDLEGFRLTPEQAAAVAARRVDNPAFLMATGRGNSLSQFSPRSGRSGTGCAK